MAFPYETPEKKPAARIRLDVARLRDHFSGKAVLPGDAGYDAARTVFYGGYDYRPAAIIQAADVRDVIEVINLARQTGLELAVRSGGHSVAGHSVSDGGIVLDLREMSAFKIDAREQTAWVEPGLTAAELTAELDAYDLALGFGDTGSVGIGGITLGGGVGFLSRKFGLTIDSLLAADIVTADGRLLRVDEKSDPDLFWAIRGGGGNFGVVTRLKFRLHPLGKIFGGMLFLPATPEVIAGFIREALAAPDELSTIANVMPAPPMPFIPADLHGQMILMAMMVYAGSAETGKQAVAPFRALAVPLADMLRPMRYPEMFPPEDGSYHPAAVSTTLFVDQIGLPQAETILRHLSNSDAPMRVAQLRALGGAISRVSVDATAYAHRLAPIMVNLAAFYTGPQDKLVRKHWVEDFAGSLRQSGWGAYSNFLGDEGPEQVRAAYPGSTWQRLREIKRRYDPHNLFRLNQNIPPAS